MARGSLFLTLLAAACTAVLGKIVPHAYIVEFEEGQVSGFALREG